MRSLPTAKNLEWEKDLKIALRGIVEVKKLPVKQPKPELNVEDLEDSDCEHTGPYWSTSMFPPCCISFISRPDTM